MGLISWRRALLLGVCSPVLTSAWAASAQTTPPSDQRGNTLQEVVVTARKRAESLQTTPVSVSAITGANLEKAQMKRIDDLGAAAPNLVVSETTGYPAAPAIRIRGIGNFDPILTGDSPVAIYVDGVYLGRTAGALMSLADVAQVEVLRGPQGTLFGRNTTGGAVSITTRAPSKTFGVEAMVGYASNNEITGQFSIDTGEIANSGWEARLTYRHHQMDGYFRNLQTSPSNSAGADNNNQIMFALHGEPIKNLTVDYKFDYQRDTLQTGVFQLAAATPDVISYFSNSAALGGAPFTLPDPTNVHTSYNSGQFLHAQNNVYGHSLTLNYYVSDALKFRSITGYRGFFNNDTGDVTGSGPLKGFASVCPANPFFGFFGPPSFICGSTVVPATLQNVAIFRDPYDHQHQFQVSQEFQALGTIGDWNYVLGLFYFNEHAGEYQPSTVDVPLPVGAYAPVPFGTNGCTVTPYCPVALQVDSLLNYDVTSESEAVFSQVSWAPSQIFDKKLELTGGIRYTHDHKTLNQNDTNAIRYGAPGSGPAGAANLGALHASFDNVSESASIKYQWAHDIMTYFRWSNGYKAGGWSARSPINGLGGPTGAYKPELVNSYEVGAKMEFFDHRLRINGDIYDTDYSQLQLSSLTSGPTGLITSTVNAGKVNYKGAELEITILPARGWQITANYGYTNPKELQYDVLLPTGYPAGYPQTFIANIAKLDKAGYDPKTTASASVQYTFPTSAIGDLTLRMDWYYVGPQYYAGGDFANGETNPANTPYPVTTSIPGLPYVTSVTKAQQFNNLGAQIILDKIPVGYGQWTLTLYGRNLLDEHQLLSGLDLTSLGVIDQAYGRGRVIGVEARAKF